MNWLDIVIIVGLAFFTFAGLRAGLIRERFALAGLLVGVVVAGQYYSTVAFYLDFVGNKQIAQVLAFLAIFFVITALAHLLSSLIQRIASILLLGWVDHLAGAVFGFTKAGLIFEFIVIAFARFPMLGMGGAVSGSFIARVLLDSLPFLLSLLPPEFASVRDLLG